MAQKKRRALIGQRRVTRTDRMDECIRPVALSLQVALSYPLSRTELNLSKTLMWSPDGGSSCAPFASYLSTEVRGSSGREDAGECGSQGSTPDVFLYHPPLYFLR